MENTNDNIVTYYKNNSTIDDKTLPDKIVVEFQDGADVVFTNYGSIVVNKVKLEQVKRFTLTKIQDYHDSIYLDVSSDEESCGYKLPLYGRRSRDLNVLKFSRFQYRKHLGCTITMGSVKDAQTLYKAIEMMV